MNTQDFIVRAAASLRGWFGIAFGAERLALVPFRTPATTVLIALVLAVPAVLGIDRIRIGDSVSRLFHSESPAFRLFEQVSHDFPSSQYYVMIVVTGDNLLDRTPVEKLRSLVTDLQLIEGTRGVLSIFSARQPAPEGALPEPVFSEPLPQGSDDHQLVERRRTTTSSTAGCCRPTADWRFPDLTAGERMRSIGRALGPAAYA